MLARSFVAIAVDAVPAMASAGPAAHEQANAHR
jgi:hypothetical protein